MSKTAWLLAGLIFTGPGFGAAEPCWRAWVVAVVNVVDGDTVDLEVSWEPRHTAEERVRLVGIDTPELHGATKPAGEAAKAFTVTWLGTAGPTEVVVCRPARDSFGRLLGHVVSLTQGDLGAALMAAGHAMPYKP
jgi:endonuclease YncB( thermonuclease family)